MRFGRKAHDPVALESAPAHRFGAVLPPRQVDRSRINFRPGLYRNNEVPDCTAAALANAARGVAYLNGYSLAVYDRSVPSFYGECIGEPDATKLAATEGAAMLDVLKHQAAHGFDIGPQKLVGLYGSVARRRIALALSIARFGAGYWGVGLTDSDVVQFEDGKPWVLTGDPGEVCERHAIMAYGYDGLGDKDWVSLATWGVWHSATWEWIEARLDEAYSIVWRQLAKADGFYNGLTVDGLAAELSE